MDIVGHGHHDRVQLLPGQQLAVVAVAGHPALPAGQAVRVQVADGGQPDRRGLLDRREVEAGDHPEPDHGEGVGAHQLSPLRGEGSRRPVTAARAASSSYRAGSSGTPSRSAACARSPSSQPG